MLERIYTFVIDEEDKEKFYSTLNSGNRMLEDFTLTLNAGEYDLDLTAVSSKFDDSIGKYVEGHIEAKLFDSKGNEVNCSTSGGLAGFSDSLEGSYCYAVDGGYEEIVFIVR